MIQTGDKIILGISGGADSVCLLFVLLEYRKRVSFDLVAVHVDHGLREDAGEDARYVEELCAEEKIPFYLARGDVKKLAAEEKCSEEDAGRRLRYRVFREAAERFGGTKLAVAHNGNDRAETMLLHLFRGSGLRGLCGIRPVRGTVIRPLLCLERREIEEYLRDRRIRWRTDSTNEEDLYARNRVRRHILPYAEREISGRVIAHMCGTADLLSETEEYLCRQTKEAREKCVRGSSIEAEVFNGLPVILRKRILLGILEELSPTGKDISSANVEDVLSLFEERGNRSVSLPFGITFMRRYGLVTWETKELAEADSSPSESLPELEFLVFSPKKDEKVPVNKYTKWFDYDKIALFRSGGQPELRFRRTGDFLTLSDGRGSLIHKSLKDYMIAEKIPRELRGRIPVLAEGSHVLWLIGYRISEYYKTDRNTKRVLQVKLKGSRADGRTEEEDGRAHQGTFIGGKG